MPQAELALVKRVSKEGVLPFSYYDYRLTPGSNLVFEVSYHYGDSSLYDATTMETLVFEVPDTTTRFHLQGRELLRHNALYSKSCLCFDPEHTKPRLVDGNNRITGHKLSPYAWRLQVEIINLSFTDTIDVRRKNVHYN